MEKVYLVFYDNLGMLILYISIMGCFIYFTFPKERKSIQKDNKKHGIPALLSFFCPGLGQIIKGDILKAVLIWIAIFFACCLIYVGFSIPVIFFVIIAIIGLFVLQIWNIYDAYNFNKE